MLNATVSTKGARRWDAGHPWIYRSDVVMLCVVYVAVGLVLMRFVFGSDLLPLLFPLASGFAIIGPFAALALYEILKTHNYQIAALLTTLTEDYDRISMHGVRSSLLDQQVAALGFPLEKVFIRSMKVVEG